MWETYGLDNEDLLWAGTALQGGIGGQRKAVCGAISSSAVCLGLRHRCSLDVEEEANQARLDARKEAGELVESFAENFGDIICQNLIGVDLSDPEVRRHFRESGMWEEKCHNYVKFAVEKLYELDEKRNPATSSD
jgi:C_GCAxxG_C_C family probable redox protein|tara:strand:+ start:801 stop:1205 length:405 start_codon:yes stop_codon:yes gene_type:complete